MTNGDKIRQMSNEELAKVIGCKTCIYDEENGCKFDSDCYEGIKAYLDMEVE